MLTKDMKKTLDLLNKSKPDLQGRFFTIGFIAQELDFDFMKALAVCESLEKESYVAFGDKYKSAVRPLEKGINFRDLEKKEFINRWIPLIISYVLSAIALIISIISLIKD